jgi:hypothetical protein
MTAPTTPTTGQADLERWYREQLRPKVARAVRRGAVPPNQAAAFERAMTQLLAVQVEAKRRHSRER